MPIDPSRSHPFFLTRRTALLGAAASLAWSGAPASAGERQPRTRPAPGPYPAASQVPGGVARLSLGPAATQPIARDGEVPLLVLGDPIEWTAIVGIPLAAQPGDARITVQTQGGTARE